MLTLVHRAQRRLFGNELLAQAANAASVALAACILLLLLGTEILDWRWLAAIPAAVACVGWCAARRRRPSLYRAAQCVDRRMGLADTLSTALYFHESGATQAAPRAVRLQAEQAERLARTVDVRAAVPFRIPRTAFPMAALLLVASSLFALRYGISRRLDLNPSLARILNPDFGREKTETAHKRRPKLDPRDSEPQDAGLAAADSQEQKAGDPQDGQSYQQDARDQGQTDSKDGQKGSRTQEQEGQAGADSQNADADDRAGNNADSESDQQGQNGGSKSGNAKQDANNSSENSSLMSKVRDAVQNLLSRMKPQQGQSGGQQQSGEQNSQAGKGQQNGGRQQSAKNGQQQSGQQQSDEQESQAGDQSQEARDGQGKGTGDSDARQASKQPGSGIGSQDGDKSIKQAEQLAAMGRISEIIGKRAQNLSGETTVEVQSTSQVLKTPYAQRGAKHSQNGAEISRDEIPVALQNYVEQYFEQVRKQKK